MSAEIKFANCKNCGDEYIESNSKYPGACSQECHKALKKIDLRLKSLRPINKVSVKREKEDAQYRVLREEFLSRPENKICPITGWPTTEIHHKRKRRGYADDWARDSGITLYLDTRFWLAVSHEGHLWIEDNPEESYKLGYSIKNNQK